MWGCKKHDLTYCVSIFGGLAMEIVETVEKVKKVKKVKQLVKCILFVFCLSLAVLETKPFSFKKVGNLGLPKDLSYAVFVEPHTILAYKDGNTVVFSDGKTGISHVYTFDDEVLAFSLDGNNNAVMVYFAKSHGFEHEICTVKLDFSSCVDDPSQVHDLDFIQKALTHQNVSFFQLSSKSLLVIQRETGNMQKVECENDIDGLHLDDSPEMTSFMVQFTDKTARKYSLKCLHKKAMMCTHGAKIAPAIIKKIKSYCQFEVRRIEQSPDGRYIGAYYQDRTLRIFDRAVKKQLCCEHITASHNYKFFKNIELIRKKIF